MATSVRTGDRKKEVHPAAPAGSGGPGFFGSPQPLGFGPDTIEARSAGLYPLIDSLASDAWCGHALIVIGVSQREKLRQAILLAIPKLPTHVREKVKTLVSPEALGVMAAF